MSRSDLTPEEMALIQRREGDMEALRLRYNSLSSHSLVEEQTRGEISFDQERIMNVAILRSKFISNYRLAIVMSRSIRTSHEESAAQEETKQEDHAATRPARRLTAITSIHDHPVRPELAARREHFKLLKENRKLKEKIIDEESLAFAVFSGSLEDVQRMISEGADVKGLFDYEFGYPATGSMQVRKVSPVEIAILKKDLPKLALLVDNDAELDVSHLKTALSKQVNKAMVIYIAEKVDCTSISGKIIYELMSNIQLELAALLLKKGASLCLDQRLNIYLEDVISTPQARLIKSAMLADKFYRMEADLNIHGTNFLPTPDEVNMIASRLYYLFTAIGKPEGFEAYVTELGISHELQLVLIKAATDCDHEDISGAGGSASSHGTHPEKAAACGAGEPDPTLRVATTTASAPAEEATASHPKVTPLERIVHAEPATTSAVSPASAVVASAATAATELTPAQQEKLNKDLMVCAKTWDVKRAEELISAGAQVNISGTNVKTALHFAAITGDDAMVRLLLDNGATIDATESSGFSAAHYAAQMGHDDVTSTLIARHADITATNKKGKTPLDIAKPSTAALIEEALEKAIAEAAEHATSGAADTAAAAEGTAAPYEEATLAGADPAEPTTALAGAVEGTEA